MDVAFTAEAEEDNDEGVKIKTVISTHRGPIQLKIGSSFGFKIHLGFIFRLDSPH